MKLKEQMEKIGHILTIVEHFFHQENLPNCLKTKINKCKIYFREFVCMFFTKETS